MRPVQNENGYVVVFVTLMIVLLLIMVGMGLDTGHLAYIRSQGQPAVDSAASILSSSHRATSSESFTPGIFSVHERRTRSERLWTRCWRPLASD